MPGLIISLVLSAVVVMTAVAAVRRGVIEVGERRYDRTDAVFWIAVVGGIVGGTAIMMVSIRTYLEVRQEDDAPPRVMERDGVKVVIPASWEPLTELEQSMGTGARDVLAVGGDGAELLVLWPPTRPLPEGGAAHVDLRVVASDLKNPAFAYERWDVTDGPESVTIDAAYPSPRGLVLARHILFVGSDNAIVVVIGTCSTEGDIADCRAVIESLTRTEQATEAPDAQPARPELRAIAAGRAHACVLDDAGEVSCWSGDTPARPVSTGVKQVVVAENRTCLLKRDETVVCLDAPSGTETPVPELEGAETLAAGPTITCGLFGEPPAKQSSVRCVGLPEPPELEAVVAIAVGTKHACALDKRGQVVCWGDNGQQQLGPAREDGVHRFAVRGVQTIAAAAQFTCALLATRQAWCWGSGFGGGGASEKLTRIEGVDGVIALAAGGGAAGGVCAHTAAGDVHCWGAPAWIGDGPRAPALANVRHLAVGATQVCAIAQGDSGERVLCWNPATSDPAQPVAGL